MPPLFQQVADAWAEALEGVYFTEIQNAIRARDVLALKSLWNSLVPVWDDRTFYDFVASSEASRSCRSTTARCSARSASAPVAGTQIPRLDARDLRVVMTNCDEDQHLVTGGVEQVPRGLWEYAPSGVVHRPVGTTSAPLHSGAPRAGVARIARDNDGDFVVTDAWGDAAITPRCSSPARVGCSPPRSSVMRACSPRGCGRHWTALDTCSRRRHSSWSTVRSGRTRTRALAVT